MNEELHILLQNSLPLGCIRRVEPWWISGERMYRINNMHDALSLTEFESMVRGAIQEECIKRKWEFKIDDTGSSICTGRRTYIVGHSVKDLLQLFHQVVSHSHDFQWTPS